MANIVLPLATLKNDGVNNINVLTENGGTVYRTQSGEIIKQTLGALPETAQSDISGLKFLAEQNGELKKVSYSGSTSGGGEDNSGSEFFDVIFYGTLGDIYCNQWIDISSSWSSDWTFTEILNEVIASERLPRITFVDTINDMTITLLAEAITSEYITMSTTMCPWSNYMFQAEYCYNDNGLWQLISPVNPFSDLEFYLWYDSNGDQVLSSNYTYSNLLALTAMNIYPVQAKCYKDNEVVGCVYLGNVGNGSTDFTFQSLPLGYANSFSTYISGFYQFIMASNGDVYYDVPTSTYNEQYDVLWYNSSDDEVGEIYLDLNPSQYTGYQLVGIWSYVDQDYNWIYHNDEAFTTMGSTGTFILEGLDSNMAGVWLGREVEIGDNYMKVSNGMVFSSDYQDAAVTGVMVPSTIIGIKYQ